MWRSSAGRSKSARLDGDDGNLSGEAVPAAAVPPDRVSFQLRSTGCLRGTHNQTIPWNLRVLFPSRSRRPGAPRDRPAAPPIRRRTYRQTLVDSERTRQTKTNNVRMNGVKAQGAETGMISLVEGGQRGRRPISALAEHGCSPAGLINLTLSI